MITLTTEQAQKIEEISTQAIKTLEYLNSIGIHSDSINPTIRAEKKALAIIRAARAQADHIVDADKMVREPVAWMRRWAFDGEEPTKDRKENGRMAFPFKFKLLPVTQHKCLDDDVPCYAAPVRTKDLTDEIDRLCAAIKAEDDYCVDNGDYMLDSNDCIKIIRGEWVRPDYSLDRAVITKDREKNK